MNDFDSLWFDFESKVKGIARQNCGKLPLP